MKSIFVLALSVALVLPCHGQESGGWSFEAGVAFRNWDADFQQSSPGRLGIGGLFNPSTRGKGDVGIFRGGRGSVIYEDGRVGPEGVLVHPNYNDDGSAVGVIDRRSQIRPTNRNAFPAAGPGSAVELSFHSHQTVDRFSANPSSRSFGSSDDSLAVGPFFNINRTVFQTSAFEVSLSFGYTWLAGDFDSGSGVLGRESVTRTRTTDQYTYKYDHDLTASGITAPGTTFPFRDGSSATVFNANKWNRFYPGANLRAPSISRDRSVNQRAVASFVATGQSSLDVDLHEFVFAPEIQFRLGDRMHAGLAVGPTLNVIDASLETDASWRRVGSTRALKSYHREENDLEVNVGVASEVSFTFDLTENFYVQATGGYRFIPDFDVNESFSSADLNMSSWQAGIGFGFRLP